ncbi:hypothetical protein OGAPHI_003035 [Ogataea philodendri]|uniref:RING-type domain-containing protein n=1 Tax=Ogataea philodendri TaxID=1378263 RepID=A0A9P8T6X7_9ASCO|nr:uncharacterized protein OGAPHI_003035 [Ogataea philodendri]KAH3667386.1 hypothetical protein OGAPHI_003035 [Ogataea philodendri]
MSSSSAAPSATATQANVAGNFIGSKPSTVLFFIALCVGVIIAVLFIFFTFRYLVRSRYGLYSPAPQFARNPFYMGPTGRASMNGLQPYFEHDMAFNFANNRPPNASRYHPSDRYSRKRKLTQEEVDDLFPIKTYAKWLNGGQEDVINRNEGVLVYEEDTTRQQQQSTPSPAHRDENSISSVHELPQETDLADQGKFEQIELTETAPATASSVDQDHLHFTSGVCAICLDNLLDDDEVRGLICGHVFHADCIDPWLVNRRGCCPMCKRDYYMRDRSRRRHGNHGQGDRDLDSIFNDSDSISDLYFPRSTKYKAQTLLACLQLVRSGQYSSNTENPVATASEAPPTAPLEDTTRMSNTDFSRPPMPDVHALQSSILEIINERPFSPEDLDNIDVKAFEHVNTKFSWIRTVFWRIMGIHKEDLYYHFVLHFYELNREQRLARQNEPAEQSNDQNAHPPQQQQTPEQMV